MLESGSDGGQPPERKAKFARAQDFSSPGRKTIKNE
jgi:hypothetical protein